MEYVTKLKILNVHEVEKKNGSLTRLQPETLGQPFRIFIVIPTGTIVVIP
jgi:hypothetical protein